MRQRQKEIDTERKRERDRQADRQTNRQTDRQRGLTEWGQGKQSRK